MKTILATPCRRTCSYRRFIDRAAIGPVLAAGLTAAALLSLLGCSSGTSLLEGRARPPLPAADVEVFQSPPPVYEFIASLTASRKSGPFLAGDSQTEALIERLKAQAARLGANGILLEEFSDDAVISLGGGVGTQTTTHNADIALGAGLGFGIFKRTGRARAIFVPRR